MLNESLSNLGAVVLAAGKGTRLGCTDLPKMMLPIAGKPMLAYTIETLERLGMPRERLVVVVGFCKKKITEFFGNRVSYAHQDEQLGTAHAAFVGMQALPASVTHALVLGGDDGMFYREETLRQFVEGHLMSGTVLSLLTAHMEHPIGFGRIIRHQDGKVEIIEKEYLTEQQRQILEVSTGTFCFNRAWFEAIYPTMPPLRKLGEFGLPTALAVARESGNPYRVVPLHDSREWFGVNTPEELQQAERRKNVHVSAGGIVYRKASGQLEILLMHRNGTDTYHLPKGTKEKDETLEDAARREIREETGCDVVLEEYLGLVHSQFAVDGMVREKETHYFAARYVGGTVGCHDGEHDNIRFVDEQIACRLLEDRGGHRMLGYEDESAVCRKFFGLKKM